MIEKDLAAVFEASLAVSDYSEHLRKYIGTLDYTLDVLVNNKDIQARPDDLMKIVRLRNSLAESLKYISRLTENIDRFREAFDA